MKTQLNDNSILELLGPLRSVISRRVIFDYKFSCIYEIWFSIVYVYLF